MKMKTPTGSSLPIDRNFYNNLPVPAAQMLLIRQPSAKLLLSDFNKAFYSTFGISDDETPIPVEKLIQDITLVDQLTILIESGSFPCKFNFSVNQAIWQITINNMDDHHFACVFNNVTSEENLKNKLTESNRQLEETQSMANLGYWMINHKEGTTFWSKGMYHILNAPEDEIPAFSGFLKYVYPDDQLLVETTFNESIRSRSGYKLTHRLITRNGLVKHVKQKCYSTFTDDQQPNVSYGIIYDITIFEFTKLQMLQNQSMFESVFEHSPIAIVIINQDLRPVFTNNLFRSLTGLQPAEIHNLRIPDLFLPADRILLNEKLAGLFAYHQRFQIDEIQLTTKSGRSIWVKISVSEVDTIDIKSAKAVLMIGDITHEKFSRHLLEESEEQYRMLIENSTYGIGMLDQQLKPIFYNSAIYSMLGYTREEYSNIDFIGLSYFHPDDYLKVTKELTKERIKSTVAAEYRIRMKSGAYLYCSFTVIPVKYKGEPSYLVFQQDVSQRKQAEMQSEEYRLFLETVLDNLPVAFFAKSTPDYKYIYWNKAIETYSGIEAEEAIGKTDFELCQMRSDAQRFYTEDEQVLNKKAKIDVEYEFTLPTSELKILRTIKTLYEPPYGNPIILGLTMDITQLKEVEKQAEASAQMVKEAQKIAKLGYWEYDVVKDLIFDNIENRQIFGTEKLGYFISLDQFANLAHPSDQILVKNEFKKCIEHMVPVENIIRFQTDDKVRHVMLNLKPIANTTNKVVKIRGTSLDITRIRRSEMALRESETKLKQAQHIAKVGYWDYDYKKKVINFSDEVWRILSVEPQVGPVNLLLVFAHVHPDDRENVRNIFFESRNNSCSIMTEFRIITTAKLVKYIEARGTFVKSADGKIDRSMGTFQDITAIKQSQLQLIQTKNQLQEILRISGTASIEYAVGQNKMVGSINLAGLLNVDEPATVNALSDYYQYIHPDDKATIIKTIEKAHQKRDKYSIQYRLALASGDIKYVCEVGQMCCDHGNEDIMLIVIQDITKIRKAKFDLDSTDFITNQVKNLAGIGTWRFNLAVRELHISDNLLSLFDNKPIHSVEELFNYIHPDDQKAVKLASVHSIKNHLPFNLTFRQVKPGSNQIFYVQLIGFTVPNHLGQLIIEGLIINHTGLYDLKNQLSETVNLYNAIAENALFAISIYQDNRFIYVNPKWEQLMGVQKEGVINTVSYFDIIQTEQATRITDLIKNWEMFDIKEYVNQLIIEPRYADKFLAKVFIKKILISDIPAFLVFFVESE